MSDTFALIPARGGSKGVLGKNILEVGGRPLIAWTIEAALASDCFDRVIVSTDCEEIKAISLESGAEVPFMRPAELASDTATAFDVLQHAFQRLEAPFEVCCYLQPTSPLRKASSLVNAMKKFQSFDADSLVSVIQVPHQYTPSSLMKPFDEYLVPYDVSASDVLRRQDKPILFARNGPAILVTRSRTLSQYKNIYGDKILSFEMNLDESVDIDDRDDLAYAEWLINRKV